jgi:hypothetical protein
MKDYLVQLKKGKAYAIIFSPSSSIEHKVTSPTFIGSAGLKVIQNMGKIMDNTALILPYIWKAICSSDIYAIGSSSVRTYTRREIVMVHGNIHVSTHIEVILVLDHPHIVLEFR